MVDYNIYKLASIFHGKHLYKTPFPITFLLAKSLAPDALGASRYCYEIRLEFQCKGRTLRRQTNLLIQLITHFVQRFCAYRKGFNSRSLQEFYCQALSNLSSTYPLTSKQVKSNRT